MSDLSFQNRRRSQRVLLQVAVLVKTEMPGGKSVQIRVFTSVVNAHGGLLDSPVNFVRDQKIQLINPQSQKAVGCRVVRVEKAPEGNYSIAFEFDQCSPHFWPITFPPEDWGIKEEIMNDNR